MDAKKTKNILIVNPFGMGDVLFSTPLIRVLREYYPAGFIGYVCNRRAEELLLTNTNINEVFVYEKDEFRKVWSQSKLKCAMKFIRLLAGIRKKKFDVLIDLSLGHQYSLFSWLIGIRKRIGFNYKNRGRFLTHKIDIEGYDSKHIVDYYLSLLQFLGIIAPEFVKLQFFTGPSDKNWARDFLHKHDINKKDVTIGLIPGGGASWGEKAVYKHWPEEKFASLIDRLDEKFSAKVIIFGDHQEKDKCNRITFISKVSSINICGETGLGKFAALLGFCDLVITNDGGPLHVAVSQGAPTVSIFGPVNETVYGPYPMDENNVVIKNDLSCRPCYRKFKIPECSNRICLQKIEVKDVFNAASQILSKRTPLDKERKFTEEKVPISVVVLTKNEESNIAKCLESVAWADEIIIVDDLSSDKTCEIASKYTNKIFKRRMDIEGRHRNWAYQQAKNNWVFSLDADERVTIGLRDEIAFALAAEPAYRAFTTPRRNFIGDYWIRWGGLYPAGQIKLFHKDSFRWEETEVHPRAFLEGKCGHLKNDLIHYTYKNWGDYLKKLKRQTALEAKKWYKLSLVNPKKAYYKMNLIHALWRTLDRFIRIFFIKKGYRDGFVGFMVAVFSSAYQFMSYAKYRELKKRRKGKTKVIFLDRDGVINKDFNSYVTSWDKFQFLDGSLEALKKLFDNGYEVVIVSNQAGVSRGNYTVEELNIINKKMLDEIKKVTGKMPYTYYCTHRDGDDCECRKPKLGLFRQAELKLGKIDYKNTYFIGDQERDMETARNLGTKSIFVLSGKSSQEQLKDWKYKPDYIKKNLLEAISWILKENRD